MTGGEVELAATLSVVIGCYYALRQKEIKRFLAYSSIVHTGFLLMADLVTSVLYLFIYTISTVLFFSVLLELSTEHKKTDITYLTDLRYLNLRDRPLHGFFILVSLVSMAGIPPLGGFYIKFWVFTNMIEDVLVYNDLNSYVILIALFITSIITMLYYLRVANYLFVGTLSLKRWWQLASDGIISAPLRVLQGSTAIFLIASIL